MLGAGDVPIEALAIKAAREYGCPPWTVFDGMTREWWDWQLAYWRAEAQVAHQQVVELRRRSHGR